MGDKHCELHSPIMRSCMSQTARVELKAEFCIVEIFANRLNCSALYHLSPPLSMKATPHLAMQSPCISHHHHHLQLGKHRLSTADTNTRSVLLAHISNLSIIQDHSPAPGAAASSVSPRRSKLGIGIAQEKDVVILDARGLGPGGHDPWVVGGDDGDDVDALGLEVGEGGLVAGEVRGGAGGGEGAGDGEEDDLLVGPICEDGVVSAEIGGGGGEVRMG